MKLLAATVLALSAAQVEGVKSNKNKDNNYVYYPDYYPEYENDEIQQRARGFGYDSGRARPPAGGAPARPPVQQQRPPYQQRPPVQQRPPPQGQRPVQQRPPAQQRPPVQQRPPQAQWRPPPKTTKRQTTTKRVTTKATTTTLATTPPPPPPQTEKVSEEVAAEFNADEGPGGDSDRKKYTGNNKPGGANYQGGGGGGGGNGSGFGDPHFVVQTAGQDQLCFDFNPVEGTDMNLLMDPETSLAISATAEERETGKTFMNTVHFASPNGAHLEFDIDGVHLAGLGDKKPTDKHPLTGHQQYGDILFVENWTPDGLHEHTKVQIEDGPTFVIKGNLIKESLSVAVVDNTGISQKSRGIIGQFIKDDAYTVKASGVVNEDGDAEGTVSAGGMDLNAVKQEWHHGNNCWVVDPNDVLFLMANL